MGFSTEWEKMYKTGAHDSVWPWSDVVSMTHRYFPGDKKGLQVLELGCGAGANIPFYTTIGASYCGIEGSITEVQKLQKRFQKENVTIKQGDFTKCLPWEGTFDLILDRSSVTHNTTKDIQKTILLVYEKLRKGGYYFGLDWFSTNYSVFSDEKEEFERIDDYTKVFRSGYFAGLGNVHFSDSDHILALFHQMEIVEMYEKTNTYIIPKGKRIAHWNFVAKK